jgi:predicted DNA-binding transcriptional regulator AlpA
MRILRCATTLDKTGYTRSPLYDNVSKGLFTKPIKIGGGRAAGWPEHEVDQIVAARIAGASEDEIKNLVLRLHDDRRVLLIQLRTATPEKIVQTASAKKSEATTSAPGK